MVELRRTIERLSEQLISAVEQRARVAGEIADWKRTHGLPLRDRARERALIERLTQRAAGRVTPAHLGRVLEAAIEAGLELAGIEDRARLRVDADSGAPVEIEVGTHQIARGRACYVAGPCAVESEAQMESVAALLSARGVGFLRGGAFKPRTSPYDFQGLGVPGLRILAAAGRRHGLATVSEATSPANAERVAQYIDVIQIGTRNMANYELLRVVGGLGRPVLLKRGFAATLGEWVGAAEYLASAGCERIIMCERGIRSFSRETRATLDLSAVPLVLATTRLPVMVDVSHAAGRQDILAPLAAAAFAAGAQAVMLEVHPNPPAALSDAAQQIDLERFAQLQHDVARQLSSLAQTLLPQPVRGDSICA